MYTGDYNPKDAGDKNGTMNTVTACINKAVLQGYEANFKIADNKLQAKDGERSYSPDQVRVNNFYRFEGNSDPADNAILYVLETTDGTKGTLLDAYGTYADDSVNKFFDQVENINKKVNKETEEDSKSES